jgi:hypothetical protein
MIMSAKIDVDNYSPAALLLQQCINNFISQETEEDDLPAYIIEDGYFGPITEDTLQSLDLDIASKEDAGILVDVKRTKVKLYPSSIAERLVNLAYLEASLNPREIGGENMGPFVKKYMDGKEGSKWPWCVGFVTYLLKLASEPDKPILKERYSSTILANQAKDAGIYTEDVRKIYPGCLFLVKDGNKYKHTGIVALIEKGENQLYKLYTLEGNIVVKKEGEKYEGVGGKVRSPKNLGFILIPNKKDM